MAQEHLSRSLYRLNRRTWLYEEGQGLTLIHEAEQVGVIPWAKVRAALARHDKPHAKSGKEAGDGK